jgi:ATP-dependent DNA helicase RecQ
MNRYYQEVGRGGRDGWTAACLLLPTRRDHEVAQGLGPRFMTPALLQQRWEAMWQPTNRKATSAGEYVWWVNPDAVRDGLIGNRTGGENARWNKRLLLQLHRAGLLRLRDVEYIYPDSEDDDPQEWIEVELLNFQPDSPRIGDSVDTQRRQELAEVARGLEFVRTYLKGEQCVAAVLRRLYGPATQRTCSGCRHSRVVRERLRECPPLDWSRPAAPRPPRVTLVANWPDPAAGAASEMAWLKLLRRCLVETQVRRFAGPPDDIAALLVLFDRVWADLAVHQRVPYRLDPLEAPQPFDVLPGERLLAFHHAALVAAATELHGGAEIVHCLTEAVPYQQVRYALEGQGHADVGFFSTPEQWLSA